MHGSIDMYAVCRLDITALACVITSSEAASSSEDLAMLGPQVPLLSLDAEPPGRFPRPGLPPAGKCVQVLAVDEA